MESETYRVRRKTLVKPFFCLSILFALCLLSSCLGEPTAASIVDSFDHYAENNGGSVITVDPSNLDANDNADAFISLYGYNGAVPDELALVDYGIIWYSSRPEGGDGAVFRAANATDAESLEKMCRRRALTIKRALKTDSKIFTYGHFVCFVCPADSDLFDGLFSKMPE